VGRDYSVAVIDDAHIQQIVQQVLTQVMGSARHDGSSIEPSKPKPEPISDKAGGGRKTVAIGSDHGGYELKELLKGEMSGMNLDVNDVGTYSKAAVDYPDYAHAVAKLVGSGNAWRGIVIDGAGIGSCIVANKVPGVRAGMAYDYSSALNGREHNDTNVLTLGAGLIGVNLARQIVRTWLSTEFGGERHARRVEKITAVEKLYAK
jgi:ribose 5-phosphate isomerase B